MPATICCEELLRCRTKKVIDQDHFDYTDLRQLIFLIDIIFAWGSK